jgi:GDPmannose 4,6-dehydratase
MVQTALITGISGQDGHHLTKYLSERGYRIVGTISEPDSLRAVEFRNLYPEVELVKADLNSFESLIEVTESCSPDEVYNLGAASQVSLSFLEPEKTANATGLGTLRLLEALRVLGANNVKFYQASSSEMFGLANESPQNETTPFHPRSPYAVAKTFAHYTTQNYREAYNMFACSGILFNHEGEYRRHDFVTRKITSNLVKIKLGKIKRFSLGTLTPERDWGYAGDYVEAMWLMLQHSQPEDFVIATGQARTVKDFLLQAMKTLDLGEEIEKFVDFDESLTRPSEVQTLVGDASKAFNKLGWKPKTSFETIVEIMIESDFKIESST